MKTITKIQSSQQVIAAAVTPIMETMETRQLLSAPHGVFVTTALQPASATIMPLSTKSTVAVTTRLGEYHGVLAFSSVPSGIIPGVGGTMSKPASFQTSVILTIESSSNHGGVTGILNARQLGTFEVTGTVSDGRALLKFTPTTSSADAVASFRGAATTSHLSGTFLEDIAGQTLHGRLRLNFIKPATPVATTGIGVIGVGTGATGTSISDTSIGATTGIGSTTTTPGVVDTTVNTGLGGIGFGTTDISGTTTALGPDGIAFGSSDISGTNVDVGTGISPTIGIDFNAPVFGGALATDVSGTSPSPFSSTGSFDISGTSTGLGTDGIATSMVP